MTKKPFCKNLMTNKKTKLSFTNVILHFVKSGEIKLSE